MQHIEFSLKVIIGPTSETFDECLSTIYTPLKKAKTGESTSMVREKTLPQPQTSQCEKPLTPVTRPTLRKSNMKHG